MIMVDTSVWIDYVNGVITPQTDALDKELQEGNVATGDLIITEFLQGFRTKGDVTAAQSIMNSLTYFDLVGKEIAFLAAQNYRVLQSKGVTVRKTIDSIIATCCIEYDLSLLHNERDFTPFAEHLGLKIYPCTDRN